MNGSKTVEYFMCMIWQSAQMSSAQMAHNIMLASGSATEGRSRRKHTCPNSVNYCKPVKV